MGRVRERKKRSDKIREEIHCVFPLICGPGRSKSRLAKAAGGEPAGQTRDEKLHAVVARSTFGSKKAKNTSRLDDF